MKLFNLYKIQKATTTSREFFINDDGIKCVHYGDIYKNYSFRFIKSSKIINTFSKEVKNSMILKEDSIIIPDVTETVSDYGHPTYIKYDGVPYINGTHALAITSAGGNLKYLFYYLQNPSNIKRLQSLLLGSTVFGISIKDFENFELINYKEADACQQHIVDIIGSIDDKIENNNKIFRMLDKQLELLFCKISVIDSNLKFRDVFKTYNGYAFKSSNYNDLGKYKIITIKNIKANGFNTDSTDKVDYKKEYDNCILSIGDILLTMTGDVGRVGIVTENNCLLNQRVLKVESVSQAYTYAFLKHNYKQINLIAKGSVQLNLGLSDLNNLKINNSLDDINKFKKYDTIIEYMINLKKENTKLNKLKQNYLLKFFQ